MKNANSSFVNKFGNDNHKPFSQISKEVEVSDSIKNTNNFYGAKNSGENTDFKKGAFSEKVSTNNFNTYQDKKVDKISHFAADNYKDNNYHKGGKKDFNNKNKNYNNNNNDQGKNFNNKNNYKKNNNFNNQKFDDNSTFEIKRPTFTNSKQGNKDEKGYNEEESYNNKNEDYENKQNQPEIQIKNTNPNFTINTNESITITNEKKTEDVNSNTQEKGKDFQIKDVLNKQPDEINTEIINSKKAEMENCIRGISNMNLNKNTNKNAPANTNPIAAPSMAINPNYNYMIPNNVNNINNINNLQNIQINNLPPMKNNAPNNMNQNLPVQNPSMPNMHMPMGINPMIPYAIPTNPPNPNMQINNNNYHQQQQHLKNYLAFPHLQNYNQMYQYPPPPHLVQGNNFINLENPQVQGQAENTIDPNQEKNINEEQFNNQNTDSGNYFF